MTTSDDMKTCEDYRETIAANPSSNVCDAHIEECESCRTFRDEMRALDETIGRALRLSVPELAIPELPELDTGNVTTLQTKRFGAPTWLALAATVAVAAVLGFRMLSHEITNMSLTEQIISHIDHEPYALRVTDKPVSDKRLARVLPATVSTFDNDDALITYAQSCIINGNTVPHLVIQGERGPITILLMQEESVPEAQQFMGEHINGVILPVGSGSIAIIGEEGEALDQVKQKVRNSVTWSTGTTT